MNLFSTDSFLETMAEVYYPGRSHSIELFELAGRWLRLLCIDGTPITANPFMDFVEPLATPPNGAVRPLRYAPWVALATLSVEERALEPEGHQSAPYIQWSRFDAW